MTSTNYTNKEIQQDQNRLEKITISKLNRDRVISEVYKHVVRFNKLKKVKFLFSRTLYSFTGEDLENEYAIVLTKVADRYISQDIEKNAKEVLVSSLKEVRGRIHNKYSNRKYFKEDAMHADRFIQSKLDPTERENAINESKEPIELLLNIELFELTKKKIGAEIFDEIVQNILDPSKASGQERKKMSALKTTHRKKARKLYESYLID